MVFINWEKFKHSLKPPTRLGIAVMMFMACFISYMMRVNLSINIIAMTVPIDKNSSELLPDTGPRYKWNAFEQGILLSSYFWGYLVLTLFGGMMAENLGAKETTGYTLLVCAVLTALSPQFAEWHFWAIFVCRFLIGVLSGVLYPCCHHLVSKWAPPSEKGKFIASLMGGTFGTVIAWPLSGLIVENLGWPWAFYIFGIISILITIIWFIVVANKPSEHKWISAEEKKFIEDSMSSTLTGAKKFPPFLSLLTSVPFWALLFLHFGSMWGLFFLITAAPKFMSEALGFKLAASGVMSSLPYLARLLAAFAFGAIGDVIRKKELLTVTTVRKSFCLFSHIIPGAFLILLAFVNKNAYGCVAIITLSLGFNGSATLTNLANSQDLAPNYAGTLYGIINFFGTLPGIFSPMIVAHFTKDESTVDQWRYVFLIGAAAYIIPALVFIAFGSGVVQKWNSAKDSGADDTKL